ncbi:MAG: hypothetical protein ACRYFA_13760 [Janthinobacterium lividum]
METHDQEHHEEHKVIGLIPSIILLIALAIFVVLFSMHGSTPH